ncbi:MAG: tRNA dihydrouridine synthase DusB [Oscillospiraceae bacterium]|nr:tRNA dihydrouridine synthase DusB [Oscillospiraceae bacterium]
MLTIGGQVIKNAVMLAPMAGVADTAFRTVCRELGFRGLMFTEMISAKGLCFGDRKSFDLSRISDAERPIGIQLFGGDPDSVARAIGLLGAFAADIIDINMGCPMPKITGNGEGAALMLDPARAADIVRAAVGTAGATPVSVKIRKGWDGGRANAVEFAMRLEDAGASMVTVHGRTRDQMYSGRADWGTIADVKSAVGIPVIGNGDVADAGDAQRMIEQTGCDGVMIARAARGAPWLLREVESSIESSVEDGFAIGVGGDTTSGAIGGDGKGACAELAGRIGTIKRHLELAVQLKGERTGLLEMRKHLAWYIKGVRNAAAIRNELFHLNDYDEVCRFINNLHVYQSADDGEFHKS